MIAYATKLISGADYPHIQYFLKQIDHIRWPGNDKVISKYTNPFAVDKTVL